MSRVLVIRGSAERDILAIAIWLGESSHSAAESFRPSVLATIQAIAEHPFAGPAVDWRPVHEGTLRRRPIFGFPNHLVFYVASEERVEIIRVLHGARDLPALFDD